MVYGSIFSCSKTLCTHFCQQVGSFPDPEILLDKDPIKVATEAKFLGLVSDRTLSFKSHIQYLKTSCQKALDILRVVGHTDRGAGRTVLLRRSLIRSRLDYGFMVYGSTRQSCLKQLDPIENQGLRIALWTFPTSIARSLYVEAQEPSLVFRR